MNFYDLDAWKCSHELTLDIYKLTTVFPATEKYGIVDQLKRATSSIGANIAEGFGRYHFADKAKFYFQARGSLSEVENFLLLAKDLNYINTAMFEELFAKTKRCEQLINGLIRSIKK